MKTKRPSEILYVKSKFKLREERQLQIELIINGLNLIPFWRHELHYAIDHWSKWKVLAVNDTSFNDTKADQIL